MKFNPKDFIDGDFATSLTLLARNPYEYFSLIDNIPKDTLAREIGEAMIFFMYCPKAKAYTKAEKTGKGFLNWAKDERENNKKRKRAWMREWRQSEYACMGIKM